MQARIDIAPGPQPVGWVERVETTMKYLLMTTGIQTLEPIFFFFQA